MSKSEGHSPAGARERALDLMLRHAEARERPEKKCCLPHRLSPTFMDSDTQTRKTISLFPVNAPNSIFIVFRAQETFFSLKRLRTLPAATQIFRRGHSKTALETSAEMKNVVKSENRRGFRHRRPPGQKFVRPAQSQRLPVGARRTGHGLLEQHGKARFRQVRASGGLFKPTLPGKVAAHEVERRNEPPELSEPLRRILAFPAGRGNRFHEPQPRALAEQHLPERGSRRPG